MKLRSAIFLTIVGLFCAPSLASTWYVRPDGGTRFSTNVTTGTCDGLDDAAPVGPTPNQHCAFNDVRMLWQDGSYTNGSTFPGWGWVISGGDTVIVRGSIGTGVSYRVGQESPTTYCGTTGCWGLTSDAGGSGPPPIPSGTSAAHTKFLGENFASCHSASAKTQLHGGWGVGEIFNISGSTYADVACLDITDFSACGQGGQVLTCDPATQDFAQTGIDMSNATNNVTLTDLHIHGLTKEGVLGPTGGNVVVSYIDILGNGDAGWQADLGDGTTGFGSLLVQHFNISWNGCAEEYPIVDPLPYQDCTDQLFNGGNGDGFGTTTTASPPPGWQVHFDQGIVSYNTQDGLDALHINGTGSSMTVTHTLAYGNMGQQIKVGGATGTVQNNIINGNCAALGQGKADMFPGTTAIPGTPAGFNSNLTFFCRAGDTAVLLYTTPGDAVSYQYNTLFSDGYVGVEIEYGTPDFGPTNVVNFNNNVFVGFFNTSHGEPSNAFFSNGGVGGCCDTQATAFPAAATNPGASWSNNASLGSQGGCPLAGETNWLCTDPGLVDETLHTIGYGNMAPASSASGIVGHGVAISGITTDYNGFTRPSPPSMGALELDVIPASSTVITIGGKLVTIAGKILTSM